MDPMEGGGLDTSARWRRQRIRAAVALGRARLRATTGGRMALVAAVGVALVHAIALLVVRETGAGPAALDATLRSAAQWLAWAAAAPLALAAANDRPAADRRDGIDALAAARGAPSSELHAARALAAMQQVALIIGAPAALLALLGAALAGSTDAALRLASVGAGALVFALAAGVTLGGLAAASARLAGPRGRSLLAALVLIPWALGDLAGRATWSIPGALDALLTLATGGAP